MPHPAAPEGPRYDAAMALLDVLNTIFAGIGALAGLAGAVIAFVALRISLQSRAKAESAAQQASAATDAGLITRFAVADALDALGRRRRGDEPSLVGEAGATGETGETAVPFQVLVERVRNGE